MKNRSKIFLFILLVLFILPSHSTEVKKSIESTIPPKNSTEATLHLNHINKQIRELSKERTKLIDERYEISEQILGLSKYNSSLQEYDNRNKIYSSYYKKALQQSLDLNQDTINSIKSKRIVSYALLAIVCLIIFSGLLATAWQIKRADDLQKSTESIEMEVELQKIKIRTSLVGVFILFLSLIFFYVFIKNVYSTQSLHYSDLPEINAPDSK
jgi:chorismate mutase